MKNNGDVVQFLKQKDYVMLNNALGSGSFGKTVLLKDPFIDEIFVAKKYEPEFENDREVFYKNFLDEIKIMYKLNHRNVARIFNYYAYEEMCTGYNIMEYINGVNIGKFISNYFPPFEVLSLNELFIQLVDGFQYIEEHGIIHRDIREGNILVDKSGIAKIIDFGIGKTFERPEDHNDSLRSEVNRDNSDTLPQEYVEGTYTSKTDQFYLAELFNRLMREAENVSETDFAYHGILSKMMEKVSSMRYDSFSHVKDAIGKQDFSVMGISDEDREIYLDFTNSLYQSLEEFVDEQKFKYDVSIFISKVEKALSDNVFEEFLQKNADVINSVVVGEYKFYANVRIECQAVRRFIDWFRRCTSQSQQLILNNIIHKLSTKSVVAAEPELPF